VTARLAAQQGAERLAQSLCRRDELGVEVPVLLVQVERAGHAGCYLAVTSNGRLRSPESTS